MSAKDILVVVEMDKAPNGEYNVLCSCGEGTRKFRLNSSCSSEIRVGKVTDWGLLSKYIVS